DQCADAGRAAQLVCRHRRQVGTELPEVNRDPAGGRYRVDVGEHSQPATVFDDRLHRLDGPDLVVGPLTVAQRRPTPMDGSAPVESILDRLDLDPAELVR